MFDACWIGVLDNFWNLRQNKSKNKRKLEDGLERATGADFKESKCVIEGSAMERLVKGKK